MGYTHALEIAVDAARQAGAALRAEFYRSGGPRGRFSHADIDEEVEADIIRPRLLAAFPHWGYRGEETSPDEAPTDADAHVWLVDPNDGTSAYLRGYRGSAVSIGLVRDGVPVLGVVYAPTAPDDDGDLIAWAEGEALTRNGDVPRIPSSAETLGPRDIVSVSHSADRHAAENALCVAPGRYFPTPSIAYRLALVAVGEARAGVGLTGPGSSGPQDWDYAGAHALLRGAGLTLVHGSGRTVSYSRHGHSITHDNIFGGDPAAVSTLRRRPWRSVFGPADPAPTYPLAHPLHGAQVADSGLVARAQGCLLGQVAGDALGSQVEFRLASDLERLYPGGLREIADGGQWRTMAGQPTDDSELALMLARSILVRQRYDPYHAGRAYVAWYQSGPFDIGGTTSQALSGLARGASTANPESEANGSLMRISPLALYGQAFSDDALATMARADSALTHPSPVCQDACAVFVIALARALRTGDPPHAIHATALEWATATDVHPTVLDALRGAAEPPGAQPAVDRQNVGWVAHALRNAFHQALHAPSFEEGLVRTVMLGGDTDTNGAIAGALLGALSGARAVPASWRRTVLTCRPFEDRPVVRPRPQPFWPVDLPILAERLLALGIHAAALDA